jgi:hypothetical protein
MGVMSCSRNACDNIMCDTYVDGDIGYVCNDCQKEFKEYLSKERINATTEGEIRRALEKFMETRKDDYTQGNEMDVNEFFKSYTRD